MEQTPQATEEKTPQGQEAPTPQGDETLSEWWQKTDPLMEKKYEIIHETLRQSPFGKALYAYMTTPMSRDEVLIQSRGLTQQIFAQGGRAITYLSALQILIQELFKNGEMNEERLKRIVILQGDIEQMQADTASYPGQGLFYLAAIAALASLPLASPHVQNALKYGVRTVARKIGDLLRMERFYEVFPDTSRPRASEFFSRKFFTEYRLLEPFRIFFKYFGPVSLLWVYWFDWKESLKGQSIETEVQQAISESRFDDLLKELSQL